MFSPQVVDGLKRELLAMERHPWPILNGVGMVKMTKLLRFTDGWSAVIWEVDGMTAYLPEKHPYDHDLYILSGRGQLRIVEKSVQYRQYDQDDSFAIPAGTSHNIAFACKRTEVLQIQQLVAPTACVKWPSR